ncbi:MAG TPA: hypothetical protein PKD64_03770 [Pirellulaceae bacterium]|nr:hypothetical protein [Pirellulaceae bacterium]HMO91289.1 hypothetical protein [Pirellulaceae bacterium]HMP68527.1 hypothetical protein [Pirellulaceae bacterium]
MSRSSGESKESGLVEHSNDFDVTGGRGAASVSRRLGVLCLLLSACVFLVTAFAWLTEAVPIAPVLVAGVVCLATGVLAHLVGEFPQGDTFMMSRLLSASVIRIGGPLAFLLFLKFSSSPWMENGVVFVVVIFYLVMLAADVGINLSKYRAVSQHGTAGPIQ